jgi:hypothetical protein
MSSLCKLCNRRACLAHASAEAHGCGLLARDAARKSYELESQAAIGLAARQKAAGVGSLLLTARTASGSDGKALKASERAAVAQKLEQQVKAKAGTRVAEASKAAREAKAAETKRKLGHS